MESTRLRVSERMKALMAYPKFASDTPRMLVLESGYWLDGACLNAARAMGWPVASAPVVLEGVMPREGVAHLLTVLGEFRPDFILSVNSSGMDPGGLLARLFEDLHVPYVTWFIDEPRSVLMDNRALATKRAVAVTWDRAYLSYLRDLGFGDAWWLPLAVDRAVFDSGPDDAWDTPPAFVGNSMIAYADREWAWVAQYPALAAAAREAFEEGRVTRERFGRGLDAMFPPEMLQGLNPDQRRHLNILCFVEGTRRLRQDMVDALAGAGLVVRGDDDWARIAPAWGGAVNYVHELPGFYRRCEVNLNVTSIQMPNTVNQRVFDCPAAGGFLLTDFQRDLEELFDVEREVVCYRSFDEARELLVSWRKRPAERRRVVELARKRILGEHTYGHRLQKLAAMLRERFADQ